MVLHAYRNPLLAAEILHVMPTDDDIYLWPLGDDTEKRRER